MQKAPTDWNLPGLQNRNVQGIPAQIFYHETRWHCQARFFMENKMLIKLSMLINSAALAALAVNPTDFWAFVAGLVVLANILFALTGDVK